MKTYAACGKFILLGEHFILYETPALALPWLGGMLQLHPSPSPPTDPKLLSAWKVACSLFSLPAPEHFPFSIRSSIPQGSGFGSSAALCVALTDAAAARAGVRCTEQKRQEHATTLECAFHGRSSGLDPAVVIAQTPVRFHRHEPPQSFAWNLPNHGFVLAVSDQERNTSKAIAQVRHFSQSHSTHFQEILTEMRQRVADTEALISGEGIQRQASLHQRAQKLGNHLTQTHHHLETVGVSSPHLDRLVQTALDQGALGAKLTGAGQGGAMLAWAPLQRLPTIERALLHAGATFSTTYDPMAHVGLLPPKHRGKAP